MLGLSVFNLDEDIIAFDAYIVDRDRGKSRSLERLSAAQIEGGPMRRAAHRALLRINLTLTERELLVAAAVLDGIHRAAEAHQHDVVVIHADRPGPALGDLREAGDPVLGHQTRRPSMSP